MYGRCGLLRCVDVRDECVSVKEKTRPMYTISQPGFVNMHIAIRPQKRTGVRVHRIEGEAVLYSEIDETTFHLNETAHLIWDACDKTKTVCDLAAILQDHYAVAEETARDDVAQIVAYLAASGLVEAEVDHGSVQP